VACEGEERRRDEMQRRRRKNAMFELDVLVDE